MKCTHKSESIVNLCFIVTLMTLAEGFCHKFLDENQIYFTYLKLGDPKRSFHRICNLVIKDILHLPFIVIRKALIYVYI